MKNTMPWILLLTILASFAPGISSATDFELTVGPGLSFKIDDRALGVVVAPGLQKAVSSSTDIGLVFAVGVFTKSASNQYSASFQVRHDLDDQLGFLIGLGGVLTKKSHFTQEFDGYLYPTLGMTYDLTHSMLEFRFSPGGESRFLTDPSLLWVGWRFPLGGIIGGSKKNAGLWSSRPWNLIFWE